MKNNKLLTILLIIFVMTTCVLAGYLVYDKLNTKDLTTDKENVTNNDISNDTENEVNQENDIVSDEDVSKEDTDSNNDTTQTNQVESKYTYKDFEEGKYQSNDTPEAFLTLWSNKVYSYYRDGITYNGTYSIEGEKIILQVLSGYNKNKEHVVPTKEIKITLNIISKSEFLDTETNQKIGRVNQPSREGNSPKETFD